MNQLRKLMLLTLLLMGMVPLCASAVSLPSNLTPAEKDGSLYYIAHYLNTPALGIEQHDDYKANSVVPHVIKQYNILIFQFALVILFYVIAKGMVNTASSGKFMGEGATMWQPIRAAVGIALIYPGSSSWNLAQAFTMYLVVAGVGAADTLWSKTLSVGGILGGTTVVEKVADKLDTNAKAVIEYVYSAELCSKNKEVNGPQGSKGTWASNLFPVDQNGAQGNMSISTQTYKTNYLRWGRLMGQNLGSQENISSECGQIEMPENVGPAYLSLQTAFHNLIDKYDLLSGAPVSNDAKEDFKIVIKKFLENGAVAASGGGSLGGVGNLSSYGWITAGFFYRELGKASGSGGSSEIAPLKTGLSSSENPYSGQALDNLTGVFSYARQGIAADESGTTSGGFNIPSSGAAAPPGWLSDTAGSLGWIAAMFGNIGAAVAALANIGIALGHMYSNVGSDPFSGPVNAGYQFMSTAVMVLMTAPIRIFASALGANTCRGDQPMGAAANVAAFMMSMIILGMCVAMYTNGALLAVFLPMIPMLIFLSAVVGWFTAVLQALVAAPLVGVGIMWPDAQHDILGKAESAIMMYLNLFLRPGLIIVGLVAAIIVCWAAFKLLTNNILYAFNNGAISISQSSPMSFMAMGFGYAFALLFIAQRSFTLITDIPDRILTWLGGGVISYGRADELVSAAREGTQSGAGMVASGMSSAQLYSARILHKQGEVRERDPDDGEDDGTSLSEAGGDQDDSSDDGGSTGQGAAKKQKDGEQDASAESTAEGRSRSDAVSEEDAGDLDGDEVDEDAMGQGGDPDAQTDEELLAVARGARGAKGGKDANPDTNAEASSADKSGDDDEADGETDAESAAASSGKTTGSVSDEALLGGTGPKPKSGAEKSGDSSSQDAEQGAAGDGGKDGAAADKTPEDGDLLAESSAGGGAQETQASREAKRTADREAHLAATSGMTRMGKIGHALRNPKETFLTRDQDGNVYSAKENRESLKIAISEILAAEVTSLRTQESTTPDAALKGGGAPASSSQAAAQSSQGAQAGANMSGPGPTTGGAPVGGPPIGAEAPGAPPVITGPPAGAGTPAPAPKTGTVTRVSAPGTAPSGTAPPSGGTPPSSGTAPVSGGGDQVVQDDSDVGTAGKTDGRDQRLGGGIDTSLDDPSGKDD